MTSTIADKLMTVLMILVVCAILAFPVLIWYKTNQHNAHQHKLDVTPHEIVCDNPLIGERRAGAPMRFFWDSNGHIRNEANTIHFVPMQGDICEVRPEEPIPMEDLVPLIPDTNSYAAGPENG